MTTIFMHFVQHLEHYNGFLSKYMFSSWQVGQLPVKILFNLDPF